MQPLSDADLKQDRPTETPPDISTPGQRGYLQSLLSALQLIALVISPSGCPATASTGSACMTLTAWDATILASTPARTNSFSLWMREKAIGRLQSYGKKDLRD